MIHLVGALVNTAATAIAVTFLIRHASVVVDSWPTALVAIVIAILVGTFAADLISGLLHWAFDTWFNEGIAPLQRMVFLVREHHLQPGRIFHYSFWHEAGMLSWFGLIGAAPFYLLAMLPSGNVGPLRYGLATTGLVLSLEVVFMLEFHKVGHRREHWPVVRALQRLGLLLPTDQHLRHHAGEHDEHYCLINGVVDKTLGRLGLFRALERLVTAVSGAVPREDDHLWSERSDRAAP